MKNLQLTFQIVFPMFFPMIIGYIARIAGFVKASVVMDMNNAIFKILLPFLLFSNIYGSDLSIPSNAGLIVFLLIAVTLFFIALCFIIPRFVKEPSRRGVMVQAIMRSNTAIFGLPIGISLVGEAYAPLFSLIIASIVLPYNLYSTIALEVGMAGKPDIAHILKRLIQNPIVIGIMAALACNALGLRIPILLAGSIKALGGIASPLSFFLLGLSFTFSAAAKNKTALAWGTISKLVIMPVLFIVPAILLGFQGVEIVCVLIAASPPTAISSFPMASAMGADGELASELVVFTSAFSIISMFLWIYALKSLGFI